ncbi:DUF3566 domain-containing protein [Amycolatopsis sp. 195334CR]|uniref:DUF3566 domain-containing protein n=1 Tax=Amycolatopsis sp. 195334CR TaxID=2814588 RepID=UPI001A8F4F00|nr:DUF3566 domain-containing protein [Amycolatopsis sp. 195334CR]MBN6035577.1 DUF3566 domain-containing protein [Amycolatopsis sp. 195334CR]
MTPSDKPENHGSNGTAAGPATPPWQRVAKDEGNGSAPASPAPAETPAPAASTSAAPSSDSGSEATVAEKWPVATETTQAQPAAAPPPVQYEHTPAGGEQPLATGSATARLFGGDSGGEAPSAVARPSGGKRPTPTALRRPGRGPRRASLQIKRFDPWSVLKLSLVLGVALFFVWLVAVGVLYTVLDGMGVWEKLNGTYTSLVQGEGTTTASEPLISAGRVFGIAAIIGAINIVLLSALATVSAFIYNVSADLAGGLEVTLSERE